MLRMEHRQAVFKDFHGNSLAESLLTKLQKMIRKENEYIKIFQNHIKHDSDREVVLLIKKVNSDDVDKNVDARIYAKPECSTEVAALVTGMVSFLFIQEFFEFSGRSLSTQHCCRDTEWSHSKNRQK